MQGDNTDEQTQQHEDHNPETEQSKLEHETNTNTSSSSSSSEQSSPRGVLEIQVSDRSESDDSCHGNSSEHTTDRSSSFGNVEEKELAVNHGNLQWKKLFNLVRKKSAVKFSTIPLFYGYDYLSKKAFRKKLGRNQSAEDAIDCVAPKPSWRSFTYEELMQATDDFSSAKVACFCTLLLPFLDKKRAPVAFFQDI